MLSNILIANRGEIARRIIRTAHAMGIATVAVYSDADAQALHVHEATQAVALHGNASADTYLRIDKLLAAAKETGADAVHPGYGFLSENADFAQAVIDAGLTWVGPPPQAIRALGSKSAAKALAQARGVPCLPGYCGADQTDARLLQEAGHIGLPLMVKAAAGGGGRGMRLVTDMDQFAAAVQSARSEAQSAFGNGELLLERALLNPRHVEVQVFADTRGHCIHLGERDCSVQRRHQKIIEETPSPAVSDALRERMTRCAVELAQAAGYVGAGTVEFLVEAGDGDSPHPNPPPAGEGVKTARATDGFYMMEMNTRLQVEHCVTEMVTGLDLVEWQIRVARGEPLPLTQEQVQFNGHAIEVRLCAEDENFTPHTGSVLHFRAPTVDTTPISIQASFGLRYRSPREPFDTSGRTVNEDASHNATLRFDHAITPGLQVTPHYDSMLGKLIAHAPTREQAITQLARALDETEILGLPTNRAFLAACLRHNTFISGQALIPFLQIHGDDIRESLLKRELLEHIPLGLQAVLDSNHPNSLPCPFPRPVRLRHRGRVTDVAVSEIPQRTPHLIAIQLEENHWHFQRAGTDLFIQDASFDPPENSQAASAANELRAPFNGKVVAVKTQPGATVQKGDVLVIVESMKLEHSLAAARAGVVKSVAVEPGQQVAPSQVLVSLEPV
jgi:geranyl-CoA carboxylase alpha subunit